jgi:hypothetical protein
MGKGEQAQGREASRLYCFGAGNFVSLGTYDVR